MVQLTEQQDRKDEARVWYRLWASPKKNARAFAKLEGKTRTWARPSGKAAKATLEPAKNGQVDYLFRGGGTEVSYQACLA